VGSANTIRFKLMNVMNKVEGILEPTALDRVFEFCSVLDLLSLQHRVAVMGACRSEQSNPAPTCECRQYSRPCPSVRRSPYLV
jgi:hypothetical protein